MEPMTKTRKLIMSHLQPIPYLLGNVCKDKVYNYKECYNQWKMSANVSKSGGGVPWKIGQGGRKEEDPRAICSVPEGGLAILPFHRGDPGYVGRSCLSPHLVNNLSLCSEDKLF